MKKLLTLIASVRYREKLEIFKAIAKIFVMKALAQEVVCIRRNGIKIKAGLRRGQGIWCAIAGGKYEPELPFLIEACANGGTFLDIGANVGVYSLNIARALGKQGKVWSFEPNPECFALLKENIEINQIENIELCRLAVCDTDGEGFLEAGDPRGQWNSLKLSHKDKRAGGIQVKTVSLDKFFFNLQPKGRIFIKVDAEGEEEGIVTGGIEFISKHRPILVLEEIKQKTHSGLHGKLVQLGYVPRSPFKDLMGAVSPNRIYYPQELKT
jgi:FkbM family methyltransferase